MTRSLREFVISCSLPAAALAAAGILALGIASSAGAQPKASPTASAAATKTIRAKDDFYISGVQPSPTVSIRKGDSIIWKTEGTSWTGTPSAYTVNPHNVTLESGPRGVKKAAFHSPGRDTNHFRFKQTFKVAGTYQFVCGLHDTMRATVTVRK